ncbi:hypothetical protein ABB29_03480 [Pseudoxanthomonas dokdonensis]|uniref:Peptidase S1A alpha-lytic prodomain domain-containing protein n=1 Tax=Pseudoxanthomonas dokdonensis TaxID=344882 RepID=A0A0R0CME7_9GAMM|nr:hypothetical protein ABB29_03480 [Pseudoxanthomonas dokdonensis]
MATAILMAFSTSAWAADDVAPALKNAMQRDLGLSGPQLAQYIKAERLANKQQKTIEKQLGRNFAGTWLERKADGSYSLVAATTAIQQAVPAGVESRQVRNSLAALKAAKQQLDSELEHGVRAPKGVYGWAVDLPDNSVTLSIAPGAEDAGIDFIARSGIDASVVRFETMQDAPKLHKGKPTPPPPPVANVNVQGGIGYLRQPGDGYLYACSVGFSVTQGSTPGFATAGHCGDAGEVVYHELSQWVPGVKLGAFAASEMPGDFETGVDQGWVKLDAAHSLSASVYGYGSGDVTVHGSTEGVVGTAICRSGRTSGWRCGAIVAKDVTISYVDDNNQPDGTVTGLTRTSACSEGGDSGGSFITGVGQAQGVLSGGSGSCSGRSGKTGGGNSYFSPINPLLADYSLTLKTSP